ncbi:Phosphoenolpyruvate phosphomutase [Blattella germanica]|nr:Phosphoenolpyruvate phosphomutase [Blattella germanica]
MVQFMQLFRASKRIEWGVRRLNTANQRKTSQLKQLLTSSQLSFLMEAHSGLSARIVQEAGFSGIWASGLSISAQLGVRDSNEASWTQVLEVVEFMADATDIPILLDADTGYGNFNNARRLVRKLEDRGIAGWGLEAALLRAEAYLEAGADAILIHSKKNEPSDIENFMSKWENKGPIVIVPTKYYKTPTSRFRDLGISTVIWANHNLRASIAAMQETCKKIMADESLTNIENKLTIQKMAEFKTPTFTKFKSVIKDGKTTIPESPLMTRLGYGTDRLKDEADILQRLNHPNIVGFRAFVKAEDGRDCLAMEECDTSIGDLVEERDDGGLGPFPADTILKVALDRNLLYTVSEKECDFEMVKLCDFGVSVSLNEDGTMKDSPENFIGTNCWAAPETLAEDGIITSKADIFSYGLVLWEMMSLQVPHSDYSIPEESINTSALDPLNNSVESAVLPEMSYVNMKYGTRPPLPDAPLGEEYNRVIELFKMCTEEDFNERPSAKEIIEILEPCK